LVQKINIIELVPRPGDHPSATRAGAQGDSTWNLCVRCGASDVVTIRALVDTGAIESCIDSALAMTLRLPVVDRRMVAGAHGAKEVNVHLAHIHVSSLNFTIYGAFCAVDLAAGGQTHLALIGRTFLRGFTMVYEGRTGTVTLHND
jgi:predicted aspartyl protease